MRYFNIMTGLRGCYMPDKSYVIAVNTRRELKSYLEDEASFIRDVEMIGCSKRAIAWLAATQWRNRNNSLPYVAPYGDGPGKYQFGIMVSPATRRDYLEYCKENGDAS